jgi:hypothetical protein
MSEIRMASEPTPQFRVGEKILIKDMKDSKGNQRHWRH